MTAPTPSVSRTVAGAAALVLLVWLAHGPGLDNGFVNYDDNVYVTENDRVLGGLTRRNIAWAFTTGHGANWHPLTWLSLQADVTLFGTDAAGFHRTNLVLHAANAVVLFLALRALTGAGRRSLAVAALFAVHPLHVESVGWVAERKDLLSALFGLLALWAYAGYVRRPGSGRFGLVFGCMALGLTAKPMLVTLPAVLLLLDVWPLGRLPAQWRRVAWEKLALLALSLMSAGITLAVQSAGGAVKPLEDIPMAARLGNAVVAYAVYLRKAVWPVDLAPFYPHPEVQMPVAPVVGAAALLVGLTVLAVGSARRRPYLLVGWLWYLGTLVPVIGLVQVGWQSLADRYTYLPLIGIYLAVVWGLADLAKAWRVPGWLPAGAGVVVLGLCVWLTRAQTAVWHDSATLWRHALAVTRDNYVAHNHLGLPQLDAMRLDEAEANFRAAVRLRPDYAEAHNNLAATLMGTNQLDEAERHLRTALELYPRMAVARSNLGLVLQRQGRLDEAIVSLRQAVKLEPGNAVYRGYLADALRAAGKEETPPPE